MRSAPRGGGGGPACRRLRGGRGLHPRAGRPPRLPHPDLPQRDRRPLLPRSRRGDGLRGRRPREAGRGRARGRLGGGHRDHGERGRSCRRTAGSWRRPGPPSRPRSRPRARACRSGSSPLRSRPPCARFGVRPDAEPLRAPRGPLDASTARPRSPTGPTSGDDRLAVGATLAIEPFATEGLGLVGEVGTPEVFRLLPGPPELEGVTPRVAAALLEMNGLPFSRRDLEALPADGGRGGAGAPRSSRACSTPTPPLVETSAEEGRPGRAHHLRGAGSGSRC